MTEAQKMVYDFIKSYIEEHGRGPSIRDIQKYMGYNSTSSVKRLIDALVERGKIGRLWGKHRSLFIVPNADDPARVKAFDACRLLVSAYFNGQGKPDWAMVHDAWMAARSALAFEYNPGGSNAHHPAGSGNGAAADDRGGGVRPD